MLRSARQVGGEDKELLTIGAHSKETFVLCWTDHFNDPARQNRHGVLVAVFERSQSQDWQIKPICRFQVFVGVFQNDAPSGPQPETPKRAACVNRTSFLKAPVSQVIFSISLNRAMGQRHLTLPEFRALNFQALTDGRRRAIYVSG